MTIKIPYRRVTVEWSDITGSSSWSRPEDIGKAAKCITRGWLIKEDEQNYYIASTIGTTDNEPLEVSDCNTIPKGCVTNIKYEGSKRGCKQAVGSSNTDAGHPAHRENVGSTPTPAATTQNIKSHSKDGV